VAREDASRSAATGLSTSLFPRISSQWLQACHFALFEQILSRAPQISLHLHVSRSPGFNTLSASRTVSSVWPVSAVHIFPDRQSINDRSGSSAAERRQGANSASEPMIPSIEPSNKGNWPCHTRRTAGRMPESRASIGGGCEPDFARERSSSSGISSPPTDVKRPRHLLQNSESDSSLSPGMGPECQPLHRRLFENLTSPDRARFNALWSRDQHPSMPDSIAIVLDAWRFMSEREVLDAWETPRYETFPLHFATSERSP
jgi:hypothetical protein